MWDANFKGVWHLDDSPADGETHADSTANAKNGTFNDADTDSDTDFAGQIDGADDLNGDADYISSGNIDSSCCSDSSDSRKFSGIACDVPDILPCLPLLQCMACY